MTPDEWEAKVGSNVRKRREELGRGVRSAAREAGISEAQWRQIESGRRKRGAIVDVVNPRPDTRSAVCRSLGWSIDSIDLLLGGDLPVVVAASDQVTTAQIAVLPSATQLVAGIGEELRAIRVELQRMGAAYEQLAGQPLAPFSPASSPPRPATRAARPTGAPAPRSLRP